MKEYKIKHIVRAETEDEVITNINQLLEEVLLNYSSNSIYILKVINIRLSYINKDNKRRYIYLLVTDKIKEGKDLISHFYNRCLERKIDIANIEKLFIYLTLIRK